MHFLQKPTHRSSAESIYSIQAWYINEQVPHIAAVRAKGELIGVVKMCVICILQILQPNGQCNFVRLSFY